MCCRVVVGDPVAVGRQEHPLDTRMSYDFSPSSPGPLSLALAGPDFFSSNSSYAVGSAMPPCIGFKLCF